MEYHKIDEVFEFEGMKLKVIKTGKTDCSNCYLQSHILCFNNDIEEMKCTSREREDKEDINYQRVYVYETPDNVMDYIKQEETRINIETIDCNAMMLLTQLLTESGYYFEENESKTSRNFFRIIKNKGRLKNERLQSKRANDQKIMQ